MYTSSNLELFMRVDLKNSVGVTDTLTHMYLLCEGEVVALSQLVFEVEGWTTAFEASALQEGDAVAENFSLIQVMGGKNDGTLWTVKQNQHRGMSNQRSTDKGRQRETDSEQRADVQR